VKYNLLADTNRRPHLPASAPVACAAAQFIHVVRHDVASGGVLREERTTRTAGGESGVRMKSDPANVPKRADPARADETPEHRPGSHRLEAPREGSPPW
jgi:hypothetical protein